jgi:hypothetical protein
MKADMFRIRLSPETKAYAETALTAIVGVLIGYIVILRVVMLL